jgi:hypothetical protein
MEFMKSIRLAINNNVIIKPDGSRDFLEIDKGIKEVIEDFRNTNTGENVTVVDIIAGNANSFPKDYEQLKEIYNLTKFTLKMLGTSVSVDEAFNIIYYYYAVNERAGIHMLKIILSKYGMRDAFISRKEWVGFSSCIKDDFIDRYNNNIEPFQD